MHKERIVNSVVNFVWKPPRYEVKWAYEPEEVPQFDPSRGADPFDGLTNEELYLDEVLLPLKNDLIKRYGKQLTVFGADPTLGESLNPPLPTATEALEYLYDSSTHQPGYTLRKWENYPRLVHVDPFLPEGPMAQDDPIPKLEYLSRFLDTSGELKDKNAFMETVVTLCNDYAPMHSRLNISDTLQGWIAFVREVNFFTNIAVRKDEIMELTPAQFSTNFVSYVKDEMQLFKDIPLVHLRLRFALSKETPSAKDVLEAITRELWAGFRFETDGRLDAAASPGQVQVKCGLRGWVYKELWEAITYKSKYKKCPRCGNLFSFSPRSAKRKWCSDSCKVMHSREMKKDKASPQA